MDLGLVGLKLLLMVAALLAAAINILVNGLCDVSITE